MGIFDFFGSSRSSSTNNDSTTSTHNVINTGRQKQNGGHDHRTNTENDRTPAQREGDAKRRKS